MAKKETILYGSPSIVTLSDALKKLYHDQQSRWPLAGKNIRALKNVKTRSLAVGSVACQVQLNPDRAISSKAKLDPKSISERPCFLCRGNRPPQQMHIDFEGAKGKRYDILVNPFPVLKGHFIVASESHVPQQIWHRYVDMLRLCKRASGYTLMYNGPKSGASAPDHFHFQAVPSEVLPVENYVRGRIDDKSLMVLAKLRDAELYLLQGYVRGSFVIVSDSSKSASKLFYKLLDCARIPEGDVEPRLNVFSFRHRDRYVSVVIMRSRHRSSHYFSEDPEVHFSMGLGCVDVAGAIVTVEKRDYDRLTAKLMNEIIEEVTVSDSEEQDIVRRLTRTQKRVCIEIATSDRIEFEMLSYGAGRRVAVYKDGKVEYGGQLYDEVVFDQRVSSTMFSEPSFVIHGASKSCRYAGGLEIKAENGRLKAVNVIGVEDYLLSRIADNMPTDDLINKVIEMRKEALLHNEIFVDTAYYGYSRKITAELREVIDNAWGRIEQ